MNPQSSTIAKEAYEAGNYTLALETYLRILREESASIEPGETGFIYHQMGNCLVKMKRLDKAIPAYGKALDDPDYDRRSALLVNMGLAYAASGDYEGALPFYEEALADEANDAPYKAYNAQGQALLKLGKAAEAGTAFRAAALDEANPDPARSLVNLGVCFMALNRPHDAVEAYRASLEFDTSDSNRSKAFANLGQAYYVTGRMREAVSSFESALENGDYQLSKAAQADYVAAKAAVADVPAEAPGAVDQEALMAAYKAGSTGSWEAATDDSAYIPPVDDTGFFSVTEDQINQMGREYVRQERKLKNIGLKILLALAILILLALGAVGFAYYKGYGYPMQETVVTDMFHAYASGGDLTQYWAQADEDDIMQVMSMVPKSDKVKITSMQRSMTDSTASVVVTTPQGGDLKYVVTLGRDMLGWKITNVELVFASTQP